jgi:hypothetical protein
MIARGGVGTGHRFASRSQVGVLLPELEQRLMGAPVIEDEGELAAGPSP